MAARRTRLVAAVALALATLLASLAVAAQPGPDPAMVALWERTDLAVANQVVSRSWLWGPQVNHVLYEPYAAGSLEDGQRLVAYYDKSRMEINDPDGDPSSLWYVTNGLLVVELATGRFQVSDDAYELAIPSNLNVAGDQGVTSPRYSDVGEHLFQPSYAVGEVIDTVYDWFAIGPGFTGRIAWTVRETTDPEVLGYDVRAAHYVEETRHTIAAPFWDFMNSTGPVFEGGQYVEGPLFPNAFLATGFPITEANWTRQDETWILFQCFERRCLTYTPDNPAGWQVEAGNVGRHYYTWRHEQNGNPCGFNPEGAIGALWAERDEVRHALRCPETIYGPGPVVPDPVSATAYQPFEHGAMLWVQLDFGMSTEQYIYVLQDRDTPDGDTFQRYYDDWDAGQPVEDPAIEPPPGLLEPVAGFGKVWREQPGVRDALGWATARESSSPGSLQAFQFGEMIWRESDDRIWVFYTAAAREPEGTWEQTSLRDS